MERISSQKKKTAEEIEAEDQVQFNILLQKRIKYNSSVQKLHIARSGPKIYKHYEEDFLSEDNDLNDNVWEILVAGLDADKL